MEGRPGTKAYSLRQSQTSTRRQYQKQWVVDVKQAWAGQQKWLIGEVKCAYCSAGDPSSVATPMLDDSACNSSSR